MANILFTRMDPSYLATYSGLAGEIILSYTPSLGVQNLIYFSSDNLKNTLSLTTHSHTQLNTKLKLNYNTVISHITSIGINHSESKATLGIPNFINSLQLCLNNNLSDVIDKTLALSNLNIKSSCINSIGLSSGCIITLDSSSKLPALDGNNLVGLISGSSAKYRGRINTIKNSNVEYLYNPTITTSSNVIISDEVIVNTSGTITLTNEYNSITNLKFLKLRTNLTSSNTTISYLQSDKYLEKYPNFKFSFNIYSDFAVNFSNNINIYTKIASNISDGLSLISTSIIQHTINTLQDITTIATSPNYIYLISKTITMSSPSLLNFDSKYALQLVLKSLPSITNFMGIGNIKFSPISISNDKISFIEDLNSSNKRYVNMLTDAQLGSGYFLDSTTCLFFVPSYNIQSIKFITDSMIISTNTIITNNNFYVKYNTDLFSISKFSTISYNYNGLTAKAYITTPQYALSDNINTSSTCWLYGKPTTSGSNPTIIDMMPASRIGRDSIGPYSSNLIVGIYGMGLDGKIISVYHADNPTTVLNTAIVGSDNYWYSTVTIDSYDSIESFFVTQDV
jgi:hypothetical protein